MASKSKRIVSLLNSASPFLLLGTASALLGGSPALAFDANSLPTGGTVTGGAASIAQSGNTMTVNQSSNRAVIDWRSFDIGANAQANFNQPGAGSIAVNRVNAGTDPSRIDGGLHANGQVWILNPNGVMFGKTARVDAAGVVATTANIDDKAFMAGDNKLQMRGGDTGSVVNEGHITVGEGGLAAFVAPSVRNSGSIRARVGKVALAAGDTYTLDLAGDRLVEIGLGAGKAVVDQAGQIVNEGGTVTISAKAAGAAVDSLINMSGLTDASSVRTAGGQIILGADNIVTTADASLKADGVSGGQITAIANKTGNYAGSYSAQGTSGDGGQIETSGKTVHIDRGIAVNTTSAQGKTGNWTLDPDDLTIQSGGGGPINGGINDTENAAIDPSTVVAALDTTNVTLQARHTILVASAIDASGNTNAHNLALTDQDGGGLTVDLAAAIKLKAGATLTGQATSVYLANGALIQNANDVALAGATITMGPGTYAAGATLNKSGLTLVGNAGALIQALNNGDDGLTISANNISVSGLEIAGPAGNTPYDSYAWGGDITRGIVVKRGATGFSIAGNNIHGTRNNILVDGLGNTGSITGNTLANSKSGISVQYTDGAGVNISGNTDGGNANEWGVNLHLNGHSSDGITFYSTSQKIAADADSATQTAILALSTANGGMTVQDQGYSNSNRTAVTVATTGSDANQGSRLNSLATIQAGVNAVVAGGTVNVNSGTYNESVILNKADVTLKTTASAVIDAGGSAYGIDVSTTAGNLGTLTIDGFTVQNWTSVGIDQSMAAGSLATMQVKNNTVYGPVGGATAHGNGIEVSGDGSVVSGNTVINDHLNSTDWSGSGIIAVNGSDIVIENNIVDGADTGIAVVNWDNAAGMSNITVRGNNVNDATDEGIGVQAFESEYFTHTAGSAGSISGLSITDNVVTNSASGLGVWDYSADHRADWSATIAEISGNSFTNNPYQISTDFDGADVKSLVGTNSFDASVVNDAGGRASDNTLAIYGDLQTALDDEDAGSTLDLAGTFAAGAKVNKAGDILTGQGAVINVSTGTTGLTINADNVAVQGIEFAGNVTTPYTAADWNAAANQGVTAIAVSGNTSTGPSGFNITGNDIHDVRTGIIVQGASASGSITGNTVENTKGGILIQYNDGAPYTISGNSEGAVGNEWGIVVNLNTAGINTPGATPLSAQQNLLALADANGGMAAMDRHYAEANRTRVVVDASSTATAADDGGHGNGLGNARQALSSIQDGVKAVVTGGTVNVKDGAYTLANELDITRGLTLKGESEAGTEITSNSTGYGINVTADNVSLQNFTYHGPAAATGSSYGIKVTPDTGTASDRLLNFDIENVTIDRGYRTGLDLNGVVGATINNVSVSNIAHGNGIALTDSADVTITNAVTSNNAWGGLALYQTNDFYDQQVNNISVDGSNSFSDTIPVYAEDESSSNDFGSIALAGFDYVVQSPNRSTDVYSWFQKTQQDAVNFATDGTLGNGNVNLATATVQGYGGSGVNGNNHFTVGIGANSAAMSVNVALDQSSAGGVIDVLNGVYAEDVSLVDPRTVNFDDATLNSLTVTSTGAGSTLSGNVAAGSVIAFGINLGGDLALDTSAADGTIDLGSVDGGHALTLNAGSGAVLVGGIGATTRLGAVDITAGLIALGATNKAAGFAFNGDVALSEASTLIDTTVSSTAAGDITFGGDIFGVTDGGQSLVLSAGPGTGAASANGDIAMNNAGLSAVRLGNMTVSGNNFSALTVDLKGDFTSTLTGNQVFAADTLNAGGNVNTQVAGDASGHVVAGGNITMDAGGNVSGTISGQAVTLTAGNTVSGTISGQTVTLTGQAVNTQVTATTLNVVAKSGTVTGTFTPGTVSNGLSLNGQVTGTGNTGGGSTVQFPTVNGQQLVVENFLLPAGTQIAADGTLVLPTGLVIGLLSPGGGPARVIMVNDVRTLGQLLSEGYSAIVIDLNAKKSGEVQVASN